MDRLPVVSIERNGKRENFHGSWYRGDHTNFMPRKSHIFDDPNGIETYILKGWLPKAPFIAKDSPILAFGSCFALYASQYLGERGYKILGRDLDIHSHLVRFGEGMVNTFSIRQQIEWAAGKRTIPEKMWFGPEKEIAAVDPEIRNETYRLIRSATTFIITLGLSEIWFDKITGEAFWRAIPSDVFDPARHGFRVSAVEENRDNLVAIINELRELSPGCHIVFTLSPIPLVATFRPVSCITANSVSKAILRVAVDDVMRSIEDDKLFYFPSYEIVTAGVIDPFMDDNRHPKAEVIQTIMQCFERHYCR